MIFFLIEHILGSRIIKDLNIFIKFTEKKIFSRKEFLLELFLSAQWAFSIFCFAQVVGIVEFGLADVETVLVYIVSHHIVGYLSFRHLIFFFSGTCNLMLWNVKTSSFLL